MSITYYQHVNVCPHCNRPERVFSIGQSAVGWSFMFSGDRHAPEGYDNSFGELVVSWKDWYKRLQQPGSKIVDEYGHEHTLEQFRVLVEHRNPACQNYTVYCRETHPERGVNHCWLDPEGYSFTDNSC